MSDDMQNPVAGLTPEDEKAEKKFKDLPPEFVEQTTTLANAKDFTALRKLVAEVALAEVENKRAQSDDQDLAAKKEAVKEANEQYSSGTKANKLKLQWIRRLLNDGGNL